MPTNKIEKKEQLTLPVSRKGRRSIEQQLKYDVSLSIFAETLEGLGKKIGDKVSARGWCYLLEGFNLIDKSQFDYVQGLVNLCRKKGLLPIDFVLKDVTRKFYNVEDLKPEYKTPREYLLEWLEYIRDIHEKKKDISYWQCQQYYIQMIVEKIDVRNLFNDICEEYHIAIANAKGWSSLLIRAKLAWRFKEAEEMGLVPVLLYYGDFDPAGLLIADKLRKNLDDIKEATKWNPDGLIIDKFGLTYDFIQENQLTWIDNLKTGSKKDLANPKHPDHNKPYVQDYIKKYGPRKVEANAILIIRDIAIKQCEETILKYIDIKASKEVYDRGVGERQEEVKGLMDKVKFTKSIEKLIKKIEKKEN
nr:MAG: Topo mini-A [uncultured archaeon]